MLPPVYSPYVIVNAPPAGIDRPLQSSVASPAIVTFAVFVPAIASVPAIVINALPSTCSVEPAATVTVTPLGMVIELWTRIVPDHVVSAVGELVTSVTGAFDGASGEPVIIVGIESLPHAPSSNIANSAAFFMPRS